MFAKAPAAGGLLPLRGSKLLQGASFLGLDGLR